jgi:hypothetical protein
MSQDLTRLRALLPLVVFVATVGLGWLLLGGQATDSTRIAERIAVLRQREAALQAVVNEPPPSTTAPSPVATFDARMSADDPTAAIVERLARLASEVRARALFIETVESASPTGRNGAPVAASSHDPRFALFDRQLTSTAIRLSFETPYAGLGQFLWNLRDLPSIVEVRTLNVRPVGASNRAQGDGAVRASMTLFAYARSTQATSTAVSR